MQLNEENNLTESHVSLVVVVIVIFQRYLKLCHLRT